MLFCFTNISVKILLQVFRLQLLHFTTYFGSFMTNSFAIISIKNYLLCFDTENVDEIDPWVTKDQKKLTQSF
jgi:hypothetical protein